MLYQMSYYPLLIKKGPFERPSFLVEYIGVEPMTF